MNNKKYLLYAEQNYAYSILRPVQAAILKRGGEVRWFLAGKKINSDYLSATELRLREVDEIINWKPDVVIAPGNTVPSFIPGLKVDIFHGFNVAKATRTDDRGHFNIRGCYDLYCTQGPATTAGFIKRAEKHGYFRVKETGWPALDPLFEPSDKAVSTSLTPTILLCSTFTPKLSCAPHLVETIKELRDKKHWQWIIQFHPKMDRKIADQYRALQNEKPTFDDTDNVIPLIKQADATVCDTCSATLMFMLQKKPIASLNNRTVGNTSYLLIIEEKEH